MTDTYSRVKKDMVNILQDDDYRVTALSGKWGTGKTYLWRMIKDELFGNKTSKQPIYVSLFGAKAINDLKLRILQNAYLTDATTVQKILRTGGGLGRDFLKKITGYSADEAALIWLPNLVAGRLIVIDDVERKHKSLDIDELLGLIDEYSENHDARFLILLNSDKLDDSPVWATLHEKVIDVEVVLNPSAVEAFDIAAKNKLCPHAVEIRTAIAKLQINNIRVIERVLKTIQHIAETGEPNNASPERWIPSSVFLTAAHYRALENAPPLSYIKSFNSFSRLLGRDAEQRDPQEIKWDALLDDLGVRTFDDYELILQEYLTTGLLDIPRVKKQFTIYKQDAVNAVATNQRDDFFTALWWDPHKTKEELLEMARALLPTVNVMFPDAVTSVIDAVEELGDKALAREFLDRWIESAPARPEYQQLEEKVFESHHTKINAEVLAFLDQMRDMQHPPLTIVEAVERIVKNSGWGNRERIALSRSTIQVYEETLKQIRNDTLRRFLKTHLQWISQGAYDENFKIGIDNFIAACANIVTANSDSRLAAMILRSFKDRCLADKLKTPVIIETPTLPR